MEPCRTTSRGLSRTCRIYPRGGAVSLAAGTARCRRRQLAPFQQTRIVSSYGRSRELPPSPGGGGIGGLRPPSLGTKNADAKHRLWSEARRGGVSVRNVRWSFALTPPRLARLRVAMTSSPTLPLQGRVAPSSRHVRGGYAACRA